MMCSRRRPRLSGHRILVEALEGRLLLASAGSLDPSFGAGTGFVTGPLGGLSSSPATSASVGAVAIQSDGKILIAGQASGDLVERLNPSGTPDTSFGQGGAFNVEVPNALGGPTALLVQPDGKILVIGGVEEFAGTTSATETYLVIRLNSNGTIDPTYGNNGAAYYAPGSPTPGAPRLTNPTSAALQPDGKLVLTGYDLTGTFGKGSTNVYFDSVRLNANGALDTTFGSGGTSSDLVPGGGYSPNAGVGGLAIQANGQILLAGTVVTDSPNPVNPNAPTDTEGVVVRLNADGSADPTFAGGLNNGQLILPPDPANPMDLGQLGINGLAQEANGQIVLEGTDQTLTATSPSGLLIRINPDGTIDATFGKAGRVFTSLVGPVAIEPNGQIVRIGTLPITQEPAGVGRSIFAALRLNTNGTGDSSFGNTANPGLSLYPFGSIAINAQVSALAIQPTDGNIILAGVAPTASGASGFTTPYAVARVLATATTSPIVSPPSPTPPVAFDGTGRSTLTVYLPALGAFAYRPTTAGAADAIVPFGSAGARQTIPAPADYEGTGQTDLAAYLPSQGVYAIRPSTGGADQLISFGIAGAGQSIPVPGDYFGTGVDDIAVYLPAIGAFGIRPSNGEPDQIIHFGSAGPGQTIPAPADYDHSGRTELGVYLPNLGAFAYRPANGGPDVIVPFGISGAGNSIPIPGDYDGSGQTELAVYFPKLGEFAYRPANGGPDVIVPFGAVNDGSIPVPGDYDDSGHDEIAIFDPNYATFAYRPANGGADVITAFGSAGLKQSLPAAAPAASNIALVNPTTLSSLAIASPNASTSSPQVVAASSKAVVVPGGPKALNAKGLARISSTRPAQLDPAKPEV